LLNLKKALKYFDEQVKDKNYIVGKDTTIADIIVCSALTYVFRILVGEKIRNEFPNLVKYH